MPNASVKPHQTGDVETLDALNTHFIRAVSTADVAWFDQHLDEDFVNTNLDGSLMDRAAFLAQVARPFPLSDFSANDVRIRVLGDAAIVHGRTAYRKPDQQHGVGRYTDVWTRRPEGWRCVAAHATRD